MESDSILILRAVAEYASESFQDPTKDPKRGRYNLSGADLERLTNLPPNRVLNAVELLDTDGYVELHQYVGGKFDAILTP